MKITEKDIGRKVIVNSINSGTINFNNRIGILKAIDDSFQWGYGIIFDKYIDVGHNLAGLCDYGYGYWVYKEDITFISPPNGFLEYFKNNNVVVNCETEQEAEWFCEWMHDNGMRWFMGQSYLNDKYKENTCYCGDGTYSEVQYFKENNIEIIKFKDLMNWKEEKVEKVVINKEFLKRFKEENFAVNCKTREEADIFCKFIDDHVENDFWNFKGENYWNNHEWCCFFNKTRYCRDGNQINSLKNIDYKIIKFKDLVFEEQIEEFEIGDKIELVMDYYDNIPTEGNNTDRKCGDRFIIKTIESSSFEEAGQGWLCDETGYGVYASICKIVRKAKDIKKEEEKEMEQQSSNNCRYRVIKPFTLKDIIEKDPCDGEFKKLVKEILDKEYYKDIFSYVGEIVKVFTENNWKKYKTLQDNLDWLEDNEFIEKVKTFEPFDLTFRIESKEELGEIYHVLNCPYNKLKEYLDEFPEYKKYPNNEIKRGKLFEIVQKEMYRIKD